jgi:hypothetical protein
VIDMNRDPIITGTEAFHDANSSLKAGLFFLLAAAVALMLPSVRNPALVALALIQLSCLVVPIWINIQRNTFDPFESVHVMGLRYFAFFGMGAIWAAQDPANVAFDRYVEPYLLQSTFYCTLGFIAFLAGYYASWFRGDVVRKTVDHPTTIWFVLIPGTIGFLGSMAGALWARASWAGINISTSISSLAQLSPLYHFAWALCWLIALSPHTSRKIRWVLLGTFIPATVMIVMNGLTDKSGAFTMVAVPITTVWYARGKLPWKRLVVLFLLLIFIIFPFFNTFKLIDPRLDNMTRVKLTADILSTWDTTTYFKASTTAVKSRLALINSVAVVVRDTPRWVPYANGRTIFLPSLAFFVPRIIWPDKPLFDLGREFGRTFRMTLIIDDMTSIAATVPGELYWNFDLPGIVIGMAIWGTAIRFFYRRYGAGKGLDPIRRATHIVLLIQFIHFGGGIAGQGVLVIRTLILIEAFLWFARRTGLLRVQRFDEA